MTRCIYCRNDTSSDGSREHVIPRCLGANLTLPPGTVCTGCNNYFGANLDPQVLQFRDLIQAVGNFQIPGRKGPKKSLGGRYYFFGKHRASVKLAEGSITGGAKGTISVKQQKGSLFPQGEQFNGHYFARVLHKIALNILAWKESVELVLQERFDGIRRYVRYANRKEFWSYFYHSDGAIKKDILYDIRQDSNELFLFLQLFGADFILSYGNVMEKATLPVGFEYIDGPKYWPVDIKVPPR